MRQFADSPKVDATQVFDLLTGVAGTPSGAPLSDAAKNLLRTVIDNGRLAALPEIATQFQALVDARTGVSQATIESAFPIDATPGRRRQGGDGAALRAGSSRPASSSSPS